MPRAKKQQDTLLPGAKNDLKKYRIEVEKGYVRDVVDKSNLKDGCVNGNTNVSRNVGCENTLFKPEMTIITKMESMEQFMDGKNVGEREYLEQFMDYAYMRKEDSVLDMMRGFVKGILENQVEVRSGKSSIVLLKNILHEHIQALEVDGEECYSFYYIPWKLDRPARPADPSARQQNQLCQELVRIAWMNTVHQLPIIAPENIKVLQKWIRYVMANFEYESQEYTEVTSRVWKVNLDNGHSVNMANYYLGDREEVERSFWRTVNRDIMHLPAPRPNPRDIFPDGALTKLTKIHYDAYFMFAPAVVTLELKLMRNLVDAKKIVPVNELKAQWKIEKNKGIPLDAPPKKMVKPSRNT